MSLRLQQLVPDPGAVAGVHSQDRGPRGFLLRDLFRTALAFAHDPLVDLHDDREIPVVRRS